MIKAIIYRRISTAGQKDNNSLDMQERDCRAYADQHGMTVIQVISDQASGGTLDRPGLDELRDLAEARAMNAIIVWAGDRLSRNSAHAAILADEFETHGVVVHYLDGVPSDCEDDSSILLNQIRAVIAEDERRRIRRRLVKGRREKVEGGKISGHGADAPFGFRFAGLKRERHLVAIPDEVAVVRQIYEWYVSGLQVMEIQRRLVAQRVPTSGATRSIRAQAMATTRARNAEARKGHVDSEHRRSYREKHSGAEDWNRATIYKILKNELYAGVMWHYKRDGKFRTRPKEQQVPVEVEAVLERELWDAAQARLADGRQRSQRKCYREYLMRTRIRCECGYARGGVSGGNRNLYYECLSRREAGRGCAYRFHRADYADRAIWQWIESVVLDEQNLREGLEAQRESAQSERRKLDDLRERYQVQLQSIDAETQKLIQLYTGGLFTLDQIGTEKARLDAAKRSVGIEVQSIDQQIEAFGLTDDEMIELTDFARLIAGRVRDADFATRVRVVELLDVRATCATVLDEQGKRIDLVNATCRLTTDAATLPICEGSRTESILRLLGLRQR